MSRNKQTKPFRSVFKTLSKIYDAGFLQKKLTGYSRYLFSQKCSITDVRQSSRYPSVYPYSRWTFLELLTDEGILPAPLFLNCTKS